MSGAFKDLKKRVYYEEQGGAPLLGVNGVCIICHGNSNARAIESSIRAAAKFVEGDVNTHIEESITQNDI
jgi:glycerol-3-phosphate acyltransferase PlsX